MEPLLRHIMTKSEEIAMEAILSRGLDVLGPQAKESFRREAVAGEEELKRWAMGESEDFLIGFHSAFFSNAAALLDAISDAASEVANGDHAYASLIAVSLPAIKMALVSRKMLEPFCPGEGRVDLSGFDS